MAVNRADEQYERKTVGCEIYVKVSEIALTAPEKQDTIDLHLEGVVLIRHPTDAALEGLETYTGIFISKRVRDFSCDYLTGSMQIITWRVSFFI